MQTHAEYTCMDIYTYMQVVMNNYTCCIHTCTLARTHTHTPTHTHTHTHNTQHTHTQHTHPHTHPHTHTHTPTHTPTHTHTHTHTYMHTYIHTCIHTYIDTYICSYLYAYMHAYIYINECMQHFHAFWKKYSYVYTQVGWFCKVCFTWNSPKVIHTIVISTAKATVTKRLKEIQNTVQSYLCWFICLILKQKI